jgi:hypothetical protein
MSRGDLPRRVLLACLTLLLLVLAWGALSGGVRQLPRSDTLGQQLETVVQLAGAVLTLLVVLTCFWRRRWARAVRAAWLVSLVLAAGLSALVWGPPMPLVALVFAGVALLVAWGTLWALHRLSADRPGRAGQGSGWLD